MITRFVEKFHQDNAIKKISASWWVGDKKLFGKNDGIYTMINLRYPYIYDMALMCKLYGDPSCIHFKDAWVLLVHTIITI